MVADLTFWNPLPYHINNTLVFPIARDNTWKQYIDNWIDFRTNDLTFERIYDQWILGKEFKKEEETWSIYENILKPKWESKKEKNTSDEEIEGQ